jgi:hypothetical protein
MSPTLRFEKISATAIHRSQKLIPLKVSAIDKMQIFANVFEYIIDRAKQQATP